MKQKCKVFYSDTHLIENLINEYLEKNNDYYVTDMRTCFNGNLLAVTLLLSKNTDRILKEN